MPAMEPAKSAKRSRFESVDGKNYCLIKRTLYSEIDWNPQERRSI